MFFKDLTVGYKIISVLEISWESSHANVAPRPFNALSFRIKGCGQISDRFKSKRISNNDVLFMPANTPYRIDCEKEKLIVIHFETDKRLEEKFEIFTPTDYIGTEKLFSKINKIWAEKKPGYYYKAMSVLYCIFENLSVQIEYNKNRDSYYQIEEAVKYIHANFNDPNLRINTLCIISGFCDTQFRKKFADVFGVTPLNYINNLRIEKACELLDGSFMSVEEIGNYVGYNDAKYFSTVFKEYMGCSPLKYRKRC